MRARTSLWASMAIVASVGLAGCGGSSDNNETNPPGSTTTPTPVDVTRNITLSKAQQAELLVALPDAGDTATLNNVGEGDSDDNPGVVRGREDMEVLFTCDSAYPCTITLENSADTIVATLHTQHIPGTTTVRGDAAGLRPDADDAFARLNEGHAATVRARLAASATPTPTEIIGMGIGGPGVLPDDAETDAGLRSDFQANGADLTENTDVDSDGTPPADLTADVARTGMPPNLRKGTTVTGGGGDGFDATSSDIAPAPEGWAMRTLFRDWGDTAGDGDGGFETGAIVVTNLGEGTSHPFDRALHDEFVNTAAQDMFELTASASGDASILDSLATSVNINASGTTSDLQWEAMEFDTASLVPAQDLDRNVNSGETFKGTYFDAPGQFRCVSTTNCALARKKDDGGKVIPDGPVVVVDVDAAMTGLQNGRWTFTPDPGAMVTVPDQDWMAYGAWLTTPDAISGDHRFGVAFNGLDTYEFALGADNPAMDNGLRGNAKYKGGATGVYVDGDNSGLFTADATLTAHFDKDSDGGALVPADDNRISGRIDNFRGTDGIYLGSDTDHSKNDPRAGGENDWVVTLGSTSFTSGAISGGTTAGSADGLSWTGSWSGNFFGDGGTDTNAVKPSGVAGQFSARSTLVTNPPSSLGETSVVGAFGATAQ